VSEDDPSKPDLSLVDTAWLIEELQRRCETVVIAREYKTQGNDHETMIEYSGSLNSAIGLVARASRLARRWAEDDD
jgi:hypothetical protein